MAHYRIFNRILSRTSDSGMAVFDIRDYGAKVDGTTNDSPAVQAALDAAVAVGGGIIYFPAGTTRLQTTVEKLSGGAVITFQGEAGASRIFPMMDWNNHALYLGNQNLVTFQDLVFIGESGSNGESSDNFESNISIMTISTTRMVMFERCGFFGIASSAGAIVYADQATLKMSDCYIACCATPNNGNITMNLCGHAIFENLFFIDYITYNGLYYNKFGAVGNTKNWIYATNAPALGDGLPGPHYVFRNCRLDENTSNGLIELEGHADRTVLLDGCAFNGGFSTETTLRFSTFRKVTMRDCYNGITLNTSDYESAIFTDVETVEIDNLLHEYGAKYLTFAGTTKRVKIRNSSLQGNATYPLGINNTAGALIDSDFGMPATASAAALAPKGRVTHVTGTTTITSITATNFKAGDELVLIFDDALTVTDGNNLKLAGNFVTTADDVLRLVYDGSNFYEVSRSVV